MKYKYFFRGKIKTQLLDIRACDLPFLSCIWVVCGSDSVHSVGIEHMFNDADLSKPTQSLAGPLQRVFFYMRLEVENK